MKILFVGDVSNYHNTLAYALRKAGHHCVVASNARSWQRLDHDLDISRADGILGTAAFALKLPRILSQMRGFDIVHFISPHFLPLKPDKLRKVLHYLKKHNSHLFYSACCTDLDYLNTCHDGSTFRYSDFLIGSEPSPYVKSHEWEAHNHWHIQEVAQYHRHFIDEEPDKVRFFIGIQRDKTILKGANRLLDAARRITLRYPHLCSLTVAENVPYKEYVQIMNSSHVILDQLYSYTPATNALIAMAQGMIAVSGAEEEYYDFIGENDNRPIINVSPLNEDDIYLRLEWIVNNKHLLPSLSRASREFVLKHNDSTIVAQKHIDFWNKICKK